MSEPLATNEIDSFRKDLERLLNRYCVDNSMNTPDFILASYLVDCLDTFDKVVKWREKWYGVKLEPGCTVGRLVGTLEEAGEALDDAVELIEHLGGNPKLQRKTLIKVRGS